MSQRLRTSAVLTFALAASALFAQTTPPTDSWPTYNGDFTGQRFSPLTKINTANVANLTLAWMYRFTAFGGTSNNPRGTPLMVDGVVYLSTTDNAFAIDARTGRELWHYNWSTHTSRHGDRGMAISGNTVYFESSDCSLIALNKNDGKLRWAKNFADPDLFYFCSVAPVVVGNHIIVGVSGDDLDNSGFIDARDPETGEQQWRFWTTPQHKGDPGMNTWPTIDQARHGGGMTWQPVTYDPQLNLIYLTTGNPQPVIADANRKGDNLYTASVIAIHADTGKMAWAFQVSPHDTHDWDATETPMLVDGAIDGRPRKLLILAARNGIFFVFDRVTGQSLVSTEYIKTNWSLGFNAKGQPIPNPAKQPSLAGTLVSPNNGGATNWFPPTYSPLTGLFYVNATRSFSIFYLYDASDNPQGWSGHDVGGWSQAMLDAIDYKTGKVKWSHPWESGVGPGLLSTAGNLIFTAAPGNAFAALNATTGDPLWHTRLTNSVTGPPSTWSLDGTQYVLVTAGDTLYAFTLQTP